MLSIKSVLEEFSSFAHGQDKTQHLECSPDALVFQPSLYHITSPQTDDTGISCFFLIIYSTLAMLFYLKEYSAQSRFKSRFYSVTFFEKALCMAILLSMRHYIAFTRDEEAWGQLWKKAQTYFACGWNVMPDIAVSNALCAFTCSSAV